MDTHSFILENSSGEKIRADLRHRQDVRDAPVIVICHGFKGFKDWGFFPDIAARLAESGYAAITFNFSRCGVGADFSRFTEMEKFAENTISHELDDLQMLLDAIRGGRVGTHIVDPERIGLLGHSRGGAVALLTAAEHPDEIECLVTWATVSNLFRATPDEKKRWKEQGYWEFENKRTGQMMRVNRAFLDDLEANRQRFDLGQAVEKVEAPTLFIHGSEDTTIPPAESEMLHERCGAVSKRLAIIEKAGHTFGIQHPMQQSNTAYETVADLTESWFDNYLQI